jgi:hypothetical protein
MTQAATMVLTEKAPVTPQNVRNMVFPAFLALGVHFIINYYYSAELHEIVGVTAGGP